MHKEVTFRSDKLSLAGTFIVPENDIALPCVIMVHGSGAQDRDGNISGFNTKIFKYIAEYLAQRGIASLRYDKLLFISLFPTVYRGFKSCNY